MKKNMNLKSNLKNISIAIMAVVALSACSGMNNRDQRMLSGAGIGAGAGAVAGAVTGGSPVTGAAIGAAAGAAGGYIYDRNKD